MRSKFLKSLLLLVASAAPAISAVAGVAMTVAVLRALPASMPKDFPRLDDVAIDTRVLAVAAGLTVAIGPVMC